MPNTRSGAARCIPTVRCKPSLGGPRSSGRLTLAGCALRFRSEGNGNKDVVAEVRAVHDRHVTWSRPIKRQTDSGFLHPCKGSTSHHVSGGQCVPAPSRSILADVPLMRSGIPNSRPKVNVTYSPNSQRFFLHTSISLQGTNSGGCMKRKKNKTARYSPFSFAPSRRQFPYLVNHRICPLRNPSETPSNGPTRLNLLDNWNQPPTKLIIAVTKHHNPTKQTQEITALQLG
jgi:hypothetical protein